MLKLSASAIVLTLGLLVASAIMAAQTIQPTPHAQMNRALYPTLGIATHAPAPVHTALSVRPAHKPAVVPVAQMNRASYRR